MYHHQKEVLRLHAACRPAALYLDYLSNPSIYLHGRTEYLISTAPIPRLPRFGLGGTDYAEHNETDVYYQGCLPFALHTSATHGSWAVDCSCQFEREPFP